jgi:hypothetical protein
VGVGVGGRAGQEASLTASMHAPAERSDPALKNAGSRRQNSDQNTTDSQPASQPPTSLFARLYSACLLSTVSSGESSASRRSRVMEAL